MPWNENIPFEMWPVNDILSYTKALEVRVADLEASGKILCRVLKNTAGGHQWQIPEEVEEAIAAFPSIERGEIMSEDQDEMRVAGERAEMEIERLREIKAELVDSCEWVVFRLAEILKVLGEAEEPELVKARAVIAKARGE